MIFSRFRLFPVSLVSLTVLLTACSASSAPTADIQVPEIVRINENIPPGFEVADGSRLLTFPEDFGAHPDFRTEWWYFTGNLDTPDGRHFGFELTFFRVGLLPPTVELPSDSQWYDRDLYFAHFAVADISSKRFYAFERYSRPGPLAPARSGLGGLAGAQSDPYHVWLEDWSVTELKSGDYRLRASHAGMMLDLTLSDEMGIILHGENGYSRKGKRIANASYYYSQPRLRADGFIKLDDNQYPVSGLAWKDHEFSTSLLDENQIGWDWFSLQFENGSILMLFQLRERDGEISLSSSGTFIAADGISQSLQNTDFEINVFDEWRSPHTGGLYPAGWEIQLVEPNCALEIYPWMADQEINFPAVTYWEGAVRFDGDCNRVPVKGNGYVELTGYAGNLPLR